MAGVVSMQPTGHVGQTVCIPGQDAFVSELISSGTLLFYFRSKSFYCEQRKPSKSIYAANLERCSMHA
jgi:hypothetical protein